MLIVGVAFPPLVVGLIFVVIAALVGRKSIAGRPVRLPYALSRGAFPPVALVVGIVLVIVGIVSS